MRLYKLFLGNKVFYFFFFPGYCRTQYIINCGIQNIDRECKI